MRYMERNKLYHLWLLLHFCSSDVEESWRFLFAALRKPVSSSFECVSCFFFFPSNLFVTVRIKHRLVTLILDKLEGGEW